MYKTNQPAIRSIILILIFFTIHYAFPLISFRDPAFHHFMFVWFAALSRAVVCAPSCIICPSPCSVPRIFMLQFILLNFVALCHQNVPEFDTFVVICLRILRFNLETQPL
eukprot:1076441_1